MRESECENAGKRACGRASGSRQSLKLKISGGVLQAMASGRWHNYDVSGQSLKVKSFSRRVTMLQNYPYLLQNPVTLFFCK